MFPNVGSIYPTQLYMITGPILLATNFPARADLGPENKLVFQATSASKHQDDDQAQAIPDEARPDEAGRGEAGQEETGPDDQAVPLVNLYLLDPV